MLKRLTYFQEAMSTSALSHVLDSDSENEHFFKNLTSSHHFKGLFSKFSSGGHASGPP